MQTTIDLTRSPRFILGSTTAEYIADDPLLLKNLIFVVVYGKSC